VTQTYALVAFQFVAFLIILYLMHSLYQQLRRDAVRRSDAPDSGRVRADVDDLVVELRRAADQINSDISARTATLQKLVDEADEKLRRLDGAMSRTESQRHGGAVAARAANAARPAIQPPTEPPRRTTGGNGARASEVPAASRTGSNADRPARTATPAVSGAANDELWPGAPTGPTVRTVPPVTTGSPAAARAYGQAARVAPPPPVNDGFVETNIEDNAKFQTVRRLAQEGLSAAEIARRTQLGREEVELIMQLASGS
jgi:hypothetical protein